ATGASTTPSTTGPYAPCPPAPGPGPTTTNTAPPATRTTTPSAPSPTASWASCTAAYATTPSTANTPPGHIAKSPKPLDELGSWDVYTKITVTSSLIARRSAVASHSALHFLSPSCEFSVGCETAQVRAFRHNAFRRK